MKTNQFFAACAMLLVSMVVDSAADETPRFRLITLDPGHFHASLVQKLMYADVDPLVHVYAPAGDDLQEHLKRIERFNTRAERPTHWREQVYTGPDFLERMLRDKAGNVVVLAGNNRRKTDYIARSIAAGMNVLADKPMAITPAGFAQLKEAFAAAAKQGVLLYDIMTERFEITTVLQRELAQQAALFGELVKGTPEEPAIAMEGVHYFSKLVAGEQLKRPAWFFDVTQEGEGITDVTTHLVDLIEWEGFPQQALSETDVTMLKAKRWPTKITREQFERITGSKEFPDYLAGAVKADGLYVSSNGAFTYRLRGVHCSVSVTWNFEASPGAGDTHHSVMRGSRSRLVINQGAKENYRSVLYVEKVAGVDAAQFEAALAAAIAELQAKYPGVGFQRDGSSWRITVPASYDVGHESHFAQVTRNYLSYLEAGRLPDWEVPNMITKYATIMRAYELSR